MNPYHDFVKACVKAIETAKRHPLGGFPPAKKPQIPSNAPKVLFFSPHPDDECISGGLALRLLREARFNVINVAVTQGSKKERQAERYRELGQACEYLGFALQPTGPAGLEKINPKTRQQDPEHWRRCVEVIKQILESNPPQIVFFPHERDWNATHIGTHLLVVDALAQLPGFECNVVETEFWGQMDDPNLMIEISPEDLGDMITAISFHVGEVKRNPYHLLLPAWMMDNVRRGGELVGGQGGAAPDFPFAVLNRVRKWTGGKLNRVWDGGKFLPRDTDVLSIFS